MSAFGYTRYGVAFGVAVNDAGTRITDNVMWATDRLATDLFELGACKGLENNYQWLYPFVGGTQVSHSFNLANPSKYRIAFEDDTTVTHNANGITGPGNVDLFGFESSTTVVDADGDTVPGPPTAVDCCCSYGIYCRSGVSADQNDFLCYPFTGTATVAHGITCRRVVDGNAVFYNGANSASGYVLVAVANPQGFYSSMRLTTATTPGNHHCYKNGALIGSIGTGGAANSQLFRLFRGNSHNLAFCYLSKNQVKSGLPFTTVMQGSYYTIMQKFQTWCGRKV